MTSDSSDVHERSGAAAAARLELPGASWLAYRDLPAILGKHVRGTQAVDFGCGAGCSTRFLRTLGFDVVGVDVAEPLLARAREHDPGGDYRLSRDGDLGGLAPGTRDLVLSVFTFDDIPALETRVELLGSLKRLLGPGGRIVSLVSAPAVHVNERVSLAAKDGPANRTARGGGKARIGMLDVEDRRPAEDILGTDDDCREAFARADLELLETSWPMVKPDEPGAWVSETTMAPWLIYVLGKAG